MDLRPHNQISMNIGWVAPDVEIIRRKGKACKYHSVSDLSNGVGQIPLSERAKQFMALAAPEELIKQVRMGTGVRIVSNSHS